MTSDLSLYFAGTVLSFVLQVAAGHIACSLLNRVLSRPRHRFAVWMLFLAASGLYWIALLGLSLRTVFHPGAGANGPAAGAIHGFAGAMSYLVPVAWGRLIFVGSEVCFAVYVVMIALLSVAFLWRRIRLHLVLRHGRPAPLNLQPVFETACRDLGLSGCELMVLPGITSPSTVGWLQPRVLLPTVCEEIGPDARLADVLQHELAHVARRDYLWAAISEVFCSILFFHPAVWRARKRMLLERELACDSAVIETRPDQRADYADSLAYFVRLGMIEEKTGVGLDFASSPSSLGTRVRFILAGPRPLPWWNRASRTAIGMAVVGGTMVVLPAITVALAFARPAPVPFSVVPTTTKPAAVTRSAARQGQSHRLVDGGSVAPVQEISRIQANSFVRETPAYSLTGGNEGTAGSWFGASGAWRENDSGHHRTVSDVVRDTVTIYRPGSDHDRVPVRHPRLTH